MSKFGFHVFLVGTSHIKASSGIWCSVLSQLPLGLFSNKPLTLLQSIFVMPAGFIKATFGRDCSVPDFHYFSGMTQKVLCG